MPSITISDLLTIIYVLVDDWYQEEGEKLLKGKEGKKPEFKDSDTDAGTGLHSISERNTIC